SPRRSHRSCSEFDQLARCDTVPNFPPPPRGALGFPPYGPPNLPSLGLALLSAGIKAGGFEFRTFYWNYRLAEVLPHPEEKQRRQAYAMLTERTLYPWNEWAFTRWVYSDELSRYDREVLRRCLILDATLGSQTSEIPPSQLIQF